MKSHLNRMLLGLVAAFLAGCGSSPDTQFLALDAVPSTQHAATVAGPPLTLGQVDLPPALNRDRFVVATGPTQREVKDTVRWTAPLPTVVRQVLARNLGDRLPDEKFVLPDQPAPAGGLRAFAVTFKTLRIQPDGQVKLNASWSVVGQDEEQVLDRGSARIVERASSGDPADDAAALSRALGRLADEMVGKLR